MFRRYHNERIALTVLWIQLVCITMLIGVYFGLLTLYVSILGIGLIYYRYVLSSFLSPQFFNYYLSTLWVGTALLWGSYFDHWLDTSFIAIILSVITFFLSYWGNKFLSELWEENE